LMGQVCLFSAHFCFRPSLFRPSFVVVKLNSYAPLLFFSTILCCISADGLAYIANLPAADEARLPRAGAVDGDGSVSPVVEMCHLASQVSPLGKWLWNTCPCHQLLPHLMGMEGLTFLCKNALFFYKKDF